MRVTRLVLLFLVSLPLFSQISITPTLISLQNSNQLYCAAKFLNPQVQVYCYTTITTNWDHLAFNSIFFVDSHTAIIPDFHQNYDQSSGRTAITFLFNRDSNGILNWQACINGLPVQKGVFQ